MSTSATRFLRHLKSERGIVMTVVIILLSALLLLGTTAFMTASTDLKISSNYKQNTRAFYDAEAGMHATLARIRAGITWPANVGDSVTVTPNRPSGYTYNTSVTLTKIGSNQYRFQITGYGANNASKTLECVFDRTSLIPAGADGAMAMYDVNPTVQLKNGGGGGYNVDGHDYTLPASFNCTGGGCAGTSTASGVPGLYTTDTTPTITGDTGHLGGFPPSTTSATYTGTPHTNSEWSTFANYIVTNGLGSTTMGTRAAPAITVIPNGSTLNGTGDGAGILIIADGGSATFNGNFHYEGLVILLGNGTMNGSGTARIFGSLITADHQSKTVDLTGTIDIYYSSAALQNLANISSLMAVSLKSWRDVNN